MNEISENIWNVNQSASLIPSGEVSELINIFKGMEMIFDLGDLV